MTDLATINHYAYYTGAFLLKMLEDRLQAEREMIARIVETRTELTREGVAELIRQRTSL